MTKLPQEAVFAACGGHSAARHAAHHRVSFRPYKFIVVCSRACIKDSALFVQQV